jgi:hypothetical protein
MVKTIVWEYRSFIKRKLICNCGRKIFLVMLLFGRRKRKGDIKLNCMEAICENVDGWGQKVPERPGT